VSTALRSAVDTAGLEQLVQEETDLQAREKLTESIEEVIDAFAAFVDRVRDAAENPDLEESHTVDVGTDPLAAFLDRVSLDEDKDKDDKNDKSEEKKGKNKVQLMSLHASKGLEFPVVFLVGLEEGLMPHRRVVEESGERGVAEERRLMYVGITRARRSLIITHAKMRRKRHDMIGRRRSRFLDDIPARCLVPEEQVPAVPVVDSAEAFFAQMKARLGSPES
jgi:superfamily I DNA/RNA helicase